MKNIDQLEARNRRVEAWVEKEKSEREIKYRAMINEGMRVRRGSHLLAVALIVLIVVGPGQVNIIEKISDQPRSYEIIIFLIWVALAYKFLLSMICYDETTNGLLGPREENLNSRISSRDSSPSFGLFAVSTFASIVRAGVPNAVIIGALYISVQTALGGLEAVIDVESWYAFERLLQN